MAVHPDMFGPTAMAYGLASVVVLLLALFANRERYNRYVDAVGSALMLLIFWCICNVLLILYGLPDALLANPPMDLLGTAVAGTMFARRPAIWKAGLTLTFLTQSAIAVAFWAGHLARHDYMLQDNILFAMELCFVALPGGFMWALALALACFIAALGIAWDCLSDRRRRPGRKDRQA